MEIKNITTITTTKIQNLLEGESLTSFKSVNWTIIQELKSN